MNWQQRATLSDALASTLFDSDVVSLHSFVSELKACRSPLARLDRVVRQLDAMLTLPEPYFALLLPFIVRLFERPETQLTALRSLTVRSGACASFVRFTLLCCTQLPLATKLGAEHAQSLLTQPLRKLLQVCLAFVVFV